MEPTFKIVLASNHQHPLFGQDYGLWRRLKYIPFTQCFSGISEDRTLKIKLLSELPGILNWAIEGLRQWRESGRLATPTIIQQATTSLKTELDTTGMFIDDCCLVESNAHTTTKELDQAYESWYREEFSLSHNERMPRHWQKNVKDDLRSKGFITSRYRTNEGTQKRGWVGFRIVKKHLTVNALDNMAQNPTKIAQKTL
jgi:putative DNA primase/helicase